MTVATRSRIHFLLCGFILFGCAGFIHVANRQGWLRLIKAPLPIRKPLDSFDRSKLQPLEVANVIKLPTETVEELGTKEYINWTLAAPEGTLENVRGCSLSVTYYTGVVDQVPHVPEECLFQGAFTQAGDNVMEVTLPQLGETVQIRRLSFYPPRDLTNRTYVYYTICVNGHFFGRRDMVRGVMADPRDSHLYYSKVEVAIREKPGVRIQELDEAARIVLDRTVTELMRSHWPLRGWERGGPPQGAGLKAGEQGQPPAKRI